jgi:prepilin-type processing-associated H-X9-DG protein
MTEEEVMRAVLKITVFFLIAVFLIGMLATAVVRWRESANRLRCQDHLRQVGWFALWDYTDRDLAFPKDSPKSIQLPIDAKPKADLTFPSGTLANPNLPPEQRLSWQVILLPNIGREPLQKQFDLSLGWQAEANHNAICSQVPVYLCPSVYRPVPADQPALTNYIGMAGLGLDAPKLSLTDPQAGFFRYDDATKAASLQRGLSYTMTIIETTIDVGPWAAGGRSTVRGLDVEAEPYIGRRRQFGGAHPGGANTSFADGSVRFLNSDMSARSFQAMVTLADRGEK